MNDAGVAPPPLPPGESPHAAAPCERNTKEAMVIPKTREDKRREEETSEEERGEEKRRAEKRREDKLK